MTETSAYYLLGYEPPKGDTGERQVEVKVRKPGLTVRARTRYFVRAPDTIGRDDAAPALAAMRAVADATDIPFRTDAFFSAQAGSVTTTLAIEIDPRRERRQRSLELIAELRHLGDAKPELHAASLTLEAADRPALVTHKWTLAAGVWQARLVLEDSETNEIGSATHTFTVPKPEELWVATPVMGEQTERGYELRLSRRFSQKSRLYCRYQVLARSDSGAAPLIFGSSGLYRGQQLVDATGPSKIEPNTQGDLIRQHLLDVSLLAPGDYTLALLVVDQASGKRQEINERFAILAP